MTKALIAISSCEEYRQNGMNDAVRETWAKDVAAVPGLDYIFFTGLDTSITSLKPDEARLKVPDDYKSVTYKTIEGHNWALQHGYDFVFQTYPDVYIRPERLMAALQTDKAYVGYPMLDPPTNLVYASGGAGYWLNAMASAMVALNKPEPYDWAEDRWVGTLMRKFGVPLHHDLRYSPIAKPPLARNQQITSHLSRGTGNYDKQWMYNTHRFWTVSQQHNQL